MMRHTLLLGLPAALLVACAPPAQHTYVAPSYQTIISTTEESQGSPPTHVIYVENRSTVPVIIFALRLENCENVNVSCGVHPSNIKLDAGRREVVERVGAKNTSQGFGYNFSYSFRVDTSYGTKVLGALAEAGDTSARVRLEAQQHADSLRRAETGPHYNDLTRGDFAVLAPRIASMRAYPDSLVLTPGEHVSIERIRLLLLDSTGSVLGQTRWLRWQLSAGALQFNPPRDLVARRPGRSIIRFSLAEDAQKLIPTQINNVEYPVIAAYVISAHSPTFEGLVRDADTKAVLACASVALEDSAENIVARQRSTADGIFSLPAPRPGTYRVRVETPGWAPAYGPSEVAKPDEDRQHQYVVKFTEQLLGYSSYAMNGDEIKHARPVALSTIPAGTSGASRGKATKKSGGAASENLATAVTLGGSESMPILGIVGPAPVGTSWMQFVVDSTGHVEPGSITIPGDTASRHLTSVTNILPRVRFSPAREGGRPVCELLRMQVNFSGR
jgi:hypothetical protein